MIGHDASEIASGHASVPSRQEIIGKWNNLVSQITQIDFTNLGTGNYGKGSTIKVWGHD